MFLAGTQDLSRDEYADVETGSHLLFVHHCHMFAELWIGRVPTEGELIANLRRDMTPEQVVALFGEPSGGRPENCIGCHFRYFASTGMLTAQREGCTGFEVQFSDGKVQAWRIFRGFPSYNPSMPMPSIFKWEFRVLGILVIFGIASGLLLRIIPLEFRSTTMCFTLSRYGKYQPSDYRQSFNSSHTKRLCATSSTGLGSAHVKFGCQSILKADWDLDLRSRSLAKPRF